MKRVVLFIMVILLTIITYAQIIMRIFVERKGILFTNVV